MHTLSVNTTIGWKPTISERMAELMHLFGLRPGRIKQQRLTYTCRLNLKAGQICIIIGSSGAGKTVLLNALYEQVHPAQRIRLDEIPLEKNAALIDCVSLDEPDVWRAADMLSKAGLSDIFTMLHPPASLSAGQQWRYRLAKALMNSRQWIFADEFTASLDRIAACVIAHNLRKLAAQTGKIFVLASCHEDMLIDLQPDVIVVKYLSGSMQTIYRDSSQEECKK